MPKRVYQFKITLKYILPAIWRRILVPETYSFWDLHVAFDEMGVSAEYEYDFGDYWLHDVLLEGILLREKGEKYPKCIAGI